MTASTFSSSCSRATGLALSLAVALGAAALAAIPGATAHGFGWLSLAVALGIAMGNLWPVLPVRGAAGFAVARGTLMRTGIALYGLNIGLGELGSVGWSGLAMALGIVLSTLLLARTLGRRLGIDTQLALLVGCGSAICGAAAVAAADSVIGARARHVSAAVLVVVAFGTLGMYLLPLLHPLTGFDNPSFGMWVGLTVHELGHVVAGAASAGSEASASALVEKMMRVMMLAPVLLVIASGAGRTASGSRGLPPFMYGFVAMIALNASGVLPGWLHAAGAGAAQFLLATGLAALGANTRLADMRSAGVRVWVLATVLWLHLVVTGFVLVQWSAHA